MEDAAGACLRGLTSRAPARREIAAFAQSYLAEWNAGVSYPADMPDVIRALASRHRLAVVSNTHDRGLVPAHLAAMGDC